MKQAKRFKIIQFYRNNYLFHSFAFYKTNKEIKVYKSGIDWLKVIKSRHLERLKNESNYN